MFDLHKLIFIPFFYSFITYRSCKHLDNKHTVFGKVVGGLDSLNAIEKVEVDNKDRPIEDIIVQKAQIFVDPYEEADEQVVITFYVYLHVRSNPAKHVMWRSVYIFVLLVIIQKIICFNEYYKDNFGRNLVLKQFFF